MNKSLAVIIPVYRSKETVRELVEAIKEEFCAICSYHIYLVDDGNDEEIRNYLVAHCLQENVTLIVLKENYDGTNTDDYMHITLTDEEEIPDVIGRLRVIYPNIMKLDYDNKRTRNQQTLGMAENVETKSPLDLFAEFYEVQNSQPMSENQMEFIQNLISEIWEDKA